MIFPAKCVEGASKTESKNTSSHTVRKANIKNGIAVYYVQESDHLILSHSTNEQTTCGGERC